VKTEIQTPEKAQQQQDYRDRYARYATQKTDTNLTLEQRDLLVAWKALEAGEAAETVAAILVAGSGQAQLIRQQQGRAISLKYLEQVMKEVVKGREPLQSIDQER